MINSLDTNSYKKHFNRIFNRIHHMVRSLINHGNNSVIIHFICLLWSFRPFATAELTSALTNSFYQPACQSVLQLGLNLLKCWLVYKSRGFVEPLKFKLKLTV